MIKKKIYIFTEEKKTKIHFQMLKTIYIFTEIKSLFKHLLFHCFA